MNAVNGGNNQKILLFSTEAFLIDKRGTKKKNLDGVNNFRT